MLESDPIPCLDEPHPTGLKPTLRQMMIVVLWAGLFFAVTREIARWQLFGTTPESLCQTIPLLVAIYPLPILAGFLWLLDRPGRVRRWYCSASLIAAHFVGGIVYSLQDLVCYALTGQTTMLFPMWPIVGLVGFWCGSMQWRTARPRACPACGQTSVIPVAHLVSPGSRRKVNTGKHGWCACCGVSCEREGLKPWTLSEPTT